MTAMATYAYMVGDELRSCEVSDAAWTFTDACDQNEALGAEARRRGSFEALASLAQSWGHAVTAEELEQFVTAVNAAHLAMRQSDELTLEELDLVSGGGGATPTIPVCTGTVKCRQCCPKGVPKCAACKCPKTCI